MRHVRYHAHGGPNVLVIEETDIPEPGPGQVLIRAEAIGVNYVDVQLRHETDPDSIYFRSLPATLTGDVVGTVERVGPDADPALAGTRVAALLEDAYADHVLADTAWLAPVPDDLDAATATLLPTIGPVALGALRAGRVNDGDTALVTSAAGGIGHLAVQLARRQGATTVIATAGSPAKLDFLKELGADVAVNHRDDDWAEQVAAAVPGGVNVAIDAVGGEALLKVIGLLAPFGRAAVYGFASGVLPDIPIRSLMGLKSLSAYSLLALRAADPKLARADVAEITELLRTGSLRTAVDTRLPLDEVVEAHRLLEDRTVIGRVVLLP